MVLAKKSYGQHFLKNQGTATEIARLFHQYNTTKLALEVGPGMGALTSELLAHYPNLKAVEADHDMVQYLAENIPEVQVYPADFMKFDVKSAYPTEEFGLVGNFPYNISSQIIFKMLDNMEQIPIMVGMFQREMADRVIAPPGSKTYGVISALSQGYYKAKIIMKLKPGSFVPPPKVDSAVILMERIPSKIPNEDKALYFKVVKQSFGQRRKMLRNTLKDLLPANVLENDYFKKRPEELGVEEFLQIVDTIKENQQT